MAIPFCVHGRPLSEACVFCGRAGRVLYAVIAVMTMSLMPMSPATASERYTRADVYASARAVVGESGWTAHLRFEDIAIVAVHQHRASLPANRGRSLAAVTRAYSSALNGHRPWVLHLGHGWPRGVSPRYMRHWDATLASVDAYLRHGIGENPVPGATNYGSRRDGPPECSHGAIRLGRELGLRSWFWKCREPWHRPRLGRAM